MTNQRRSGFRLPWGGPEQETDATPATEPPTGVTESNAQPDTAQTAATDPGTETKVKDATQTVGPDAEATPAAPSTPSAPVAAAPSVPSPFLRSLVEAMRGVAEEARASSLSELKAKVEQRVEHLGAAGAELAEDLRRQSELDIKGIGDWERGEIERIRGEAARKVEARRQQLEQQLVERQQQTEREIEATRSRLAEYERELAAFVGELADIDDPAAFVDAARRMPHQPTLDVARAATSKPESNEKAVDSTLSDRLAKLGAAETATSPSVAESTTPGTAEPSSNGQHSAADDTNATTAIVVKGLGSFGAITSFKQSLEKSGGIRAVSLSLGPTGEFVYRATHDPNFDIEAAIREAESGASSIERQADGTVRVNVVRAR